MMAPPKDVYLQMAANNRKLLALIVLFPVSLAVFVYAFLWLFYVIAVDGEMSYEEYQPFLQDTFSILVPIIILICVGTTIFSLYAGKDLILNLTGARLCPDTQHNRKVYQAVENIALAAGIPMPKVYVIRSPALNAFATGYSPNNAAVTLTSGLIERLSPLELEAVIAHEIGHILNRDIRLNLFIITGIGLIGLFGELLIRIRLRGNSKGKSGQLIAILILIGLALYLYRYFVAPLLHMAISRTQEFQADATSAYLTRNPQALIDALSKISENPTVDDLSSKSFAAMCIFNPLDKVSHLLDTHPPIQERIARLEQMS
ncbi:MAG: M48 family metallopeptidase [Alphaproteobacteria bacterium]|nr:M48 family metallopeptidase [Alphaproteobacteria bacterium]